MRAGQPVLLAILLLVSSCAVGADSTNKVAHRSPGKVGYYDDGIYTPAAIPIQRQMVYLIEKTHGPEHLRTAHELDFLGRLYLERGDNGKAEPCLQRALKIREKALGMEHPTTAQSLNNLAVTYMEIGDYDKARPLFQRALKIWEKNSPNSERGDAAGCLNNLAGIYEKIGNYDEAEQLFRQALKTREAKLGPDHPDTADSLNSLANICLAKGDYERAESHCLQVLNIYKKADGSKRLRKAHCLSTLGQLYMERGDYGRAESVLQQAQQIDETTVGPEHHDTAEVFGNVSMLQLSLGHVEAASSFAVKQRTAVEKNLGMVLAFTSEPQRMKYRRDNRYSDLLASMGNVPNLAEALLRTKGIVLDSLLEDQLAAEASKNPEVKNAVSQLRATGRRLNQLQMGIPSDLSPEALKRQQAERETIEQQVEELQKTLARNVAGLGQIRRALRIKTSDVQAVLPKNAVLLEFVRYGHYLGKGKFEQRYGTVLIGSPQKAFKDTKPGAPVWVPLGSARTIEQYLKEYVARMRGEKKGETDLLHTLYTQLFEPIQKRLPKDITTLIISPDAELNFVSFATFVDDQNKFLAEQYAIEYVASGRDLVLKRIAKTGSRRFAAFANPSFGEKPLMVGAHSTNVVQLTMLSSDQRDYRGEILKPLPYTIQEAQFLREKSSSWNMDGSVYAGAEASEAEVRAVKSPHILHLATHGFFLDDKLPTTNHPAAGWQLLGNDRTPVVPHNPMQRSGLAFAGAQLTLDAWKKGETPDTENDGILMGQEIGTIDLKETWLVVLSACDTGIGEARAGEGVLGLRRGFIQAGAQNLLMTLWPVSDKWTVDLMKAFYERALKNNNAPQALAEVQRDFLVKIRNEKKNAVIAARLAGPFVMTFQGKVQ